LEGIAKTAEHKRQEALVHFLTAPRSPMHHDILPTRKKRFAVITRTNIMGFIIINMLKQSIIAGWLIQRIDGIYRYKHRKMKEELQETIFIKVL